MAEISDVVPEVVPLLPVPAEKPVKVRGNRIARCIRCLFLGDKGQMRTHVIMSYLEMVEAPYYCSTCSKKWCETKPYMEHKAQPAHRARCVMNRPDDVVMAQAPP